MGGFMGFIMWKRQFSTLKVLKNVKILQSKYKYFVMR